MGGEQSIQKTEVQGDVLLNIVFYFGVLNYVKGLGDALGMGSEKRKNDSKVVWPPK